MSLHLYLIDSSLPLPCLSDVIAPTARGLGEGPHAAQRLSTQVCFRLLRPGGQEDRSKEEMQCNQESRPARCSPRAGNRLNIKNKAGQHKDMKDTRRTPVFLCNTPLTFPWDQGKLTEVVCEATLRLEHLPNPRCKAPYRKEPRWPGKVAAFAWNSVKQELWH